MLVRSVTPRDTGVYRCDSDLTGEASVQVYVVPPEDLMKSLHLHGAVEKTDSSQSLYPVKSKGVKDVTQQNIQVTTSKTYSSFTSRGVHKSNSFYDHPTKSHSEDYKKYLKNKTRSGNAMNVWKMSPSIPSSASNNVLINLFFSIVTALTIFTHSRSRACRCT